MDSKTYSAEALKYANPRIKSFGPILEEALMGLNGEAGECIDILKKHMFQDHALDKEHLKSELGDVMWYVNRACQALGITLEQLFDINISKLHIRFPEDRFDRLESINRKEEDK